MDEMPDLSHLSAEEREIIMQVFQRQKAEEEKEGQISQKADEELDAIEKQINERKENARRLIGTQDDAICQICQKTKFADGIGHKCFYCQLRSCARCGGRTQSKNKPIWACSLCQKRQQIMAKTGKWFQQPDENKTSPCQSASPTPSTSNANLPQVIPPGGGQIQQPGQGPPGMPGPGVPGQQQQQSNQQPVQRQHTQTSQQQQPVRNGGGPPRGNPQQQQQQNGPVQGQQRGPPRQDQRRQNSLHRQPSLESDQYREQGNGALPQQPSTRGPQQVQNQQQQRTRQPSFSDRTQPVTRKTSQQHRMQQQHHQQALNPNPNQERPHFYTDNDAAQSNSQSSQQQQRPLQPHQQQDQNSPHFNPFGGQGSSGQPPVSHGQARSAEFRRTRSIREDEHNRRGSISVQLQPVEVAAVPISPGPRSSPRTGKQRLHRQIRSMSSSDEDQAQFQYPAPADPLRPSADDAVQRVPNECTSEKDLLRYIYGSEKAGVKGKSNVIHPTTDARLASPPRQTAGIGNVIPGDMLAAKIRTYLSHPVTWQPSADQRKLIGHMILHRTDSAANGDLGLKVVGGRRSDTGRLGAFITRVKAGSVADTVGRLRPGDEVLEWNGQPLQNATFDQVYEIVSASKHESQIELIVSRSAKVPGGDDFLNVQQLQPSGRDLSGRELGRDGRDVLPNQRVLPNPQLVGAQQQDDVYLPSPIASPHMQHSQSALLPLHGAQYSPRHAAYVQTVPLPTLSDPLMLPLDAQPQQKGQIFGRIEIALFYSLHDRQLTVSIVRAIDLPPRPDGVPRNPYVKIFLLPDRSEKSRRQSAVLAETVMPVWGENFFYHSLTEPMLTERVLEVTVWDYDKYDTNSFLGETLVDFSQVPLDGQPLLYTLVDMDDESPLRLRLRNRRVASMPARPRSEMTFGRRDRERHHPGHVLDVAPGGGAEYGYEPPGQRLSDAGMRRSRTYDRAGMHGGMIRGTPPVRAEDDWTQHGGGGSGYLSDHGYSQPSQHHRRQRRPRSATAMRPMTAAEMSASRMYSRQRGRKEWDEAGEYSGAGEDMPPQPHPHQRQMIDHHNQMMHQQQQQHTMRMQQQMMANQGFPMQQPVQGRQGYMQDPRSPNGRLLVEAVAEQQAGYGSDGSETISIQSGHSAPVRTINRRRGVNGDGSVPDMNSMSQDHEEYDTGGGGSAVTQQQMKERKKSLMTRLIPGRNAPLEGKRTGFARSEEVGIPQQCSQDRLQAPFLKQCSKQESTDSSHSDNWLPVLPDGPLGTFVDNLGPGQVVGRQVLASPVLGEIQIGIMAGRSGIDVEVIRAKNLVVKPGTKISPAPYVKVYLMEGKQCIAKAKTQPVRKTTSPLFQQHLIFNDSPKKKMLQITVLGDYGRMERKSFMGIVQIRLDDLQLGPEPVIGWYKLYHSSSLAGTGPVRKDSEISLTGGQ